MLCELAFRPHARQRRLFRVCNLNKRATFQDGVKHVAERRNVVMGRAPAYVVTLESVPSRAGLSGVAAPPRAAKYATHTCKHYRTDKLYYIEDTLSDVVAA